MLKYAAVLAAGCILGATGAQVLQAQQNGIKRAVLQRLDMPASAGAQEAILGAAEIASGVAAGRHTHAGIEVGYVLSGEARMEIAGQPPRVLRAGDSYAIPAGAAHDAIAGDQTTKVVAVYVVEKGKPLATPAP